ncbi:sulfur carrier protein ThiS adenylyltransferase ThiF [Oscillospiraceae bacterium LCP25S3_E10]|nr:sulfur carrier protein ThiS adenylyltransferase ThiF [Ruminococcus sp.]MDD6447744.1 sulfur carrier protein ThiS adenylyltransferase ThiF [Ruminococcus sp.]MDY2857094.1 sulfur carrier protein ThiS adenylyltransferase ThiF [Oscillospiraceae bacterium]
MNITLNGENFATNAHCVSGLSKESLFTPEWVVIVNGFQISEDTPIKDGDSVFIIPKGTLPGKEQLEAMLMARHTPKVHTKVKKASVAVMGLGGLGSNIVLQLARTGIGSLHLIDYDVVEPSNLNRQQYMIKHLGMLKTEALKEQIQQVNPYVNVKTTAVKLTEDNIIEYIKHSDVICEAFDKPECKAMAVNAVLENLPDKYMVASSGMAGLESSNAIATRKIGSRLYICGDGVTAAKQSCGLMAPRVSICAGHMANMILRIITENYDV